MRVVFGVFIFFANIVLLVFILLTDLLLVKSITHVTLVFGMLFSCWVLANWLALKISRDVLSILRRMPESAFSSVSGIWDGHSGLMKEIPDRTMLAEVDTMIGRYNMIVENGNNLAVQHMRIERESATIAQAQQVAHDVRSPLAALTMVLPDLQPLPEETRLLIKSAIHRIEDITNELQSRRKPLKHRADPAGPEKIMLSGLAEALISEKRAEYRERLQVTIETKIDTSSYGVFVDVCAADLKRVLSNLVNNAVEAIRFDGSVSLFVTHDASGSAYIHVTDNGPGIPPEVLSRLGQKGNTFQKEGGQGLGIYHAFTVAESSGGEISFDNMKNGARVTFRLPCQSPPEWFLGKISLSLTDKVVILDDDASIHTIWQERFAALVGRGLVVRHIAAPDAFRDWVNSRHRNSDALFLMDYELLGHRENGLDLVDSCGLQDRAILVTSHYEDPDIVARCIQLRVKMIPKSMAPFVPIEIRDDSSVDAVLIDNDLMIRKAWSMAAKRAGKKLLTSSDLSGFLEHAREVDYRTDIYIDYELGDGVIGTDVAAKLHDYGYKSLYLATGRGAKDVVSLPFLLAIRDKTPPFHVTKATHATTAPCKET